MPIIKSQFTLRLLVSDHAKIKKIGNSNFPHPNTPKSQESSREQTINYAATHENGNDLRR